MVALGLFGIIAALFGPIKYGILPDFLKTQELAAGNGLIESGTFVAILAGTVAGGFAAAKGGGETLLDRRRHDGGHARLLGLIAVHPAPGRGGPRSRRHPESLDLDAGAGPRPQVGQAVWDGTLIVSWFWLAGAVALSLLPSLVSPSSAAPRTS